VCCTTPSASVDVRVVKALTAACVQACPSLRFLLISALGAGDSLDALPSASHEVLRAFLERKDAAEAVLVNSGLEWTLIRPGPLTDEPPNGLGVATLDCAGGRAYSSLSRAELASVTAKAAVSGKSCRRALSVLDGGGVTVSAPFMRKLEPWEAPPFESFAL
jgi:hypothetical protein